MLTYYLIEAKKNFKRTMDIAIYYDDNSVYANRLAKAGIKITRLKIKRKYSMIALWKTIKIVRQGRYTIVFAQLFPTTLYVALASLFLPHVTFILRETSSYTRRRKYRFLKIFDRFIYSRYKTIICVDKAVEAALRKWVTQVTGKTKVIEKGISLPTVKGKCSKSYDVVFVGRLVQAKGIDILLDALAKIEPHQTVKNAIIVGDGPLISSLRKKAVSLRISHMVTFLGERHDVSQLLQMSRVFVLPSRWEGTPSALLEAMATGLPVVASAVGGITQVIDNGIDGLLVPPEDAQFLGSAIEKALSDKQLAHKLSKNARKKVEQKFSIKHYTDRLLVLLDSIE